MENLGIIEKIVVWAIPTLFAVTVHEVAHGWVAKQLGDKTAWFMGRLTLNPLKHIDPLGTLLVPALCLLLGGFVFGWAKPVPINWYNLRNPRRDSALVAIAGPAVNLLMALFWALMVKLAAYLFQGGMTNAMLLAYMGYAGISINLMLMVLNLIPIPPLDGSRVVSSFLTGSIANFYNSIERFGFMILLFLIFTNVLSMILNYPYQWLLSIIRNMFVI